MSLDPLVAACLVPVALWILLSGLDDLFITLVYLLTGKRRPALPPKTVLDHTPPRRIAILVPLWREDRVIGQMLDRNLNAIRYENYDVFVGVYPNDHRTVRAVTEAAERHARVHMAVCPHDGPTSKGDCLNWIYRRMQAHEARYGVRFEVVMTHDAEDLIHPESLRLINWYSAKYDMVQVPVLPLPTGFSEFTHGLYCDEFAEFQAKDIPVRQRLGGFLPSNGVGTGFRRSALDRLANTREGMFCDPECLTEDYENGFELHAMGCRQIFLQLHFEADHPIATREYFPRDFRAAVRQRSRWVAGIVLQSWQRHGWRVPWRQVYWFWRDRKGLVGNLLTPLANLLFAYGVASYYLTSAGARHWHLGGMIPWWVLSSCRLTMAIAIAQLAIRMSCGARIYGWRFAATAPLRIFWGNTVNSVATLKAVGQFAKAKVHKRSLAWSKTDHDYPARVTAERGRPRLGEVLIKMRLVSMGDIEEALRTRQNGLRLGEQLISCQRITEEHLYQALSRQAEIPLGLPYSGEVDRRVTRMLPAGAAARWTVLPYRVSGGQLHVLTPNVPSEAMERELAGLSELGIRFRLVRPHDFEAMAKRYLPGVDLQPLRKAG